MKMKGKDDDYNFTCRLGIVFILVFLLLNVFGQIKRTEPRQIISPMPITEAKEITEVLPAPKLSEREEIEKFGQEVFGNEWPLFKKIIWCESKFNPKAFNGQDTGLAQINQVHQIAPKWLKNWKINLLVAEQLFREQGLTPWRYSENCWKTK